MFVDDILFVECGGEIIPFTFEEDGRMDALLRRRYEVQNRYEELIAQYERELERIRHALARSPNDHTNLQMEHLYKCRIQDARVKMASQIEEIRDEERRHQARINDHERSQSAARPPNGGPRNMLMYGFSHTSAMPG
jgi:hypothetical protein